MPWEWRHLGFFSNFIAGLLGHSAGCCPFPSCSTSSVRDFPWTNDAPCPGILAKGGGRVRNSTRAVVTGSGLSAQCSEGRAAPVWTLSEQPGSSSAPPHCTHRQWSQLPGAAGLSPTILGHMFLSYFYLPRNGALLSYYLKQLRSESIPVLCELKACEQPMNIFWINHFHFLLPIIRRAHRKWAVKYYKLMPL